MRCPHCDKPLQSLPETCPDCGGKLGYRTSAPLLKWLLLIVILALLVSGGPGLPWWKLAVLAVTLGLAGGYTIFKK
jgi:hypothetical protein